MSAARFGEPVEDAAAALALCGARDYNLEGIQTYLVLEDADGRPLVQGLTPGEAADGRELAVLATRYLAQIASDAEEPSEEELGCTLEVLGTYHFEPLGSGQ
jgi:hypothetical protein